MVETHVQEVLTPFFLQLNMQICDLWARFTAFHSFFFLLAPKHQSKIEKTFCTVVGIHWPHQFAAKVSFWMINVLLVPEV